jgi:hypothetical protein
MSGFRDRVRASLEEIARRELGPAGRRPDESGRLARELADVRRDLEQAQRTMALAASPDQFRAVSEVFDQLRVRERELEQQLATARAAIARPTDAAAEVDAAWPS